jgi:hypothetical protein
METEEADPMVRDAGDKDLMTFEVVKPGGHEAGSKHQADITAILNAQT